MACPRCGGDNCPEMHPALVRELAEMARILRDASDNCSGYEPSLSLLQRRAELTADRLDILAGDAPCEPTPEEQQS